MNNRYNFVEIYIVCMKAGRLRVYTKGDISIAKCFFFVTQMSIAVYVYEVTRIHYTS